MTDIQPGLPPSLAETPGELESEARPYPRSAGLGRTIMIVGAAAAMAGGVLVLALPRSEPPRALEDVPLVKADPEPAKVKPEDPGGIAIPDQDKLVYGLIDPTAQEGEVVERLLPPPEEPVVVEPAPPPEPPSSEEPAATIGEALEAVPPLPDEPEAGDLAELAPAAGTTVEPVAETQFEAVEDTVAALATATEPEPEPVAAGHVWRVQVGAVRNSAEVDPEWARVKKKLGDLVTGLPLHVETADLGSEQGLYHRLQVGAFAERDGAAGLCEEFKALKVDCLVVKR